jgi:uncharacterized integral membrane protein
MRTIYTAVLILFTVVVGIFCVQNLETVAVSFLGWSMNLPLAILVLLVYVLGMISGSGVWWFLRRSASRATEPRR